MPYSLEFRPAARVGMRNLAGLSRKGRIKLFANLDSLRYVDDQFLADPINRSTGDLIFTTIFRDRGAVRVFLYRVDDSQAVAGVLRVLTVEDLTP